MGKRERDLEKGFIEEDYFANSIMIQFNYENPFKPSDFQDYTEHWDLGVIGRKGSLCLIDVKGKKNDTYEFHDIEFQNIKGKIGWMLGKATHIAFRISDEHYCVVKRLDLLKHTLKYVVNESMIDNYLINFNKYGYEYELKNLIDIPSLTVTDRYKHKHELYNYLYMRYKRSDFNRKNTNIPNDDIVILIKTNELLDLEHTIVNFCITPMIYVKKYRD